MIFRRKGDKNKYYFVDQRCIGRMCWAPGMYRSSSYQTPCCMRNAYHGCPDGPESEWKTELCTQCEGTGEILMPDGIHTCCVCCGHKTVTVAGLPIFDPEKARQRKAEGWRKA